IEHYANYIGLALLVGIGSLLYLRHRRDQHTDAGSV
ncbi:MAG: hypothetical protein QOH17_4966, partial [Pseudonocardiales bacterium]|nr:hypothetical protein [Pseudonocardiales bacterium]